MSSVSRGATRCRIGTSRAIPTRTSQLSPAGLSGTGAFGLDAAGTPHIVASTEDFVGGQELHHSARLGGTWTTTTITTGGLSVVSRLNSTPAGAHRFLGEPVGGTSFSLFELQAGVLGSHALPELPAGTRIADLLTDSAGKLHIFAVTPGGSLIHGIEQ